jgi:hypothetical protein
MFKKVLNFFPLVIFFFANQQLSAQAFLNGSFEVNTAAACDYNMSNATFNTRMSNCTAYGGGGELDIMQTTCPYGPSQSGTWFAALAAPAGVTDAFTMMLSAPLVAGVTYTMSFWDKGDIGCCPPGMPVIIGVSTVAGAAGTLVYTGPTPTTGAWNQRCFSFVAPNNGQHISVSTAGPTRWSHVDNFVLNGGCTVLPIELLCFRAECKDNTTLLSWSTLTEKNNQSFTIEYSPDGVNFSEVGMKKGAGNSNKQIDYEFIYLQSQKDVGYFRLKQTDYDQSNSYSNVIGSEKCKSIYDFQFELYPNPSNDNLNIRTGIINTKLVIANTLGQIVYESALDLTESIIDISHLECGIYFVQLISNGKTQSKKFIKN